MGIVQVIVGFVMLAAVASRRQSASPVRASPVDSAQVRTGVRDTLGTARSDVSSSSDYWAARNSMFDCNGNHRSDDEDLFLGASSDVDCDGTPDECQEPSEIAERTHGRPCAGIWPKSYYVSPPVRIRYSIPKGSGEPRLEVLASLGKSAKDVVRRLSIPRGRRAGFISWNGHDDHGRAVPIGLYTIRLVVDGSSCSRQINYEITRPRPPGGR